MKKWYGGMLILFLASVLVLRYCLMGKPTHKQSAYDFFHPHPTSPANVYNYKAGSSFKSLQMEAKELQGVVKKPSLIKVEGLADLYSSNNISKEESTPLLVWPELQTILSRSDGLPETWQGVKEASVAWKELLFTIEEHKVFESRNVSSSPNFPEDRDCPYSVDSFNTTVSTGGSFLKIPCGLVEDSSVTVIGIPDGQQHSFEIELIGSQFPEEPKPPIVLHYEVFFPGENLTAEPVIVQNTWTNELGWGKEEKCPDRENTNNANVDALVKCNGQVIRPFAKENSNLSIPNGDKVTNYSNGSALVSVNFPFIEGSPITATLWVGAEGFHMTVNGRHETSFAYREKLEPWLVSGVKVTGGLNFISALAKGLPVSEDLTLATDVEYLKAPPIHTRRLVMFIGVFSSGNNFERRMALRRSWMQYEAVRSGDVAVRFFVGLHKNRQVNFELWREAQAYGDVQLMPFLDYYGLLTLKSIAIFILGTKIFPAKYIMKMDDDAFVRVDAVLSSLKERPTNGLLYGHISFDSPPQRDKDNKWYMSTEEWPHATYPPWAHGPGYIISRDIAKFIVRGHEERFLKLFKLEDVATGIWIEQFKEHGNEVQYVNDNRFDDSGCNSDYLLAHYQNPRMVLCLWEVLQKEQKPLCCE